MRNLLGRIAGSISNSNPTSTMVLWMLLMLSSWFLFVVIGIVKHKEKVIRNRGYYFVEHLGMFDSKACGVFEMVAVGSIVVFGLVLYIYFKERASKKDHSNRHESLVLSLIPVILLGIFISTTGGLLNSPFSLATGVYITSILLISEEQMTYNKRLRQAILLMSMVAMLLLPYFYLWHYYNSMSFFIWASNNTITWTRVIVTILFVLYTGIISHIWAKNRAKSPN